MIIVKEKPLEQAVSIFDGLYESMRFASSVTDTAREVRLRSGQPVTVEYDKGRFVSASGKITPAQLSRYMQALCSYSVHSCEQQLRDGCITLKGGHRAGFCGTAVIKNGRLETVKDISSINIRIAREHIGCGEECARIVYSDGFKGLLIAGAPLSGKTTMLRDLCRIVSASHKLSVVDSRGELAAAFNGTPQLDIGANTDVLNGYEKVQGILLAIRVLSPEYVACDEITGEQETIATCLHYGVKPLITAHCGDLSEALQMPAVKSGAISHVVMLGTGKELGKVIGISCAERSTV